MGTIAGAVWRTGTENPLPSVPPRVARGLIPIFTPVLPGLLSPASLVALNSLKKEKKKKKSLTEQPSANPPPWASPFFKARSATVDITSVEGGETASRGEWVMSPCVLAEAVLSILGDWLQQSPWDAKQVEVMPLLDANVFYQRAQRTREIKCTTISIGLINPFMYLACESSASSF